MEKFQFCKPVGEKNPGNWGTEHSGFQARRGEKKKKFLEEKTCANLPSGKPQ